MIGGAVLATICKNPLDGLPNSATAATWSATAAGIGPVRPAGIAKPAGTESAVRYPATAAPCEKPPSTILVSGHSATTAWTLLLASMTPSAAVWKSSDAGYATG